MKNISKIKHVPQKGPTCGIYAIVMIMSALYPKQYKTIGDKDKLAIEVFKIAIKEGISEVGELFKVSDVVKLLNIFKEKNGLFFNVNSIQFKNAEEMKENMDVTFRSNGYILFPYYKKYTSGDRKKNKHIIAHWAVFYSVQYDYLLGEQSGKSCGKAFNKRKKHSDIRVDKNILFKSNQELNYTFSWEKYYNLNKYLELFLISIIKVWKKYSDLELAEYVNVNKRKNREIKYELQGKMIEIKK